MQIHATWARKTKMKEKTPAKTTWFTKPLASVLKKLYVRMGGRRKVIVLAFVYEKTMTTLFTFLLPRITASSSSTIVFKCTKRIFRSQPIYNILLLTFRIMRYWKVTVVYVYEYCIILSCAWCALKLLSIYYSLGLSSAFVGSTSSAGQL